ncbi:MAG: UrcA family protein [Pseudomonadota bacterium]
MKIIVTTAAALAFAISAVASPASAGVQPVIVSVDISDLDLSDEAAVEKLEKRLAGQIRLACGVPNTRSSRSMRAVRACRAYFNERVGVALSEIAERPERYADLEVLTLRT